MKFIFISISYLVILFSCKRNLALTPPAETGQKAVWYGPPCECKVPILETPFVPSDLGKLISIDSLNASLYITDSTQVDFMDNSNAQCPFACDGCCKVISLDSLNKIDNIDSIQGVINKEFALVKNIFIYGKIWNISDSLVAVLKHNPHHEFARYLTREDSIRIFGTDKLNIYNVKLYGEKEFKN